jgi:hypothetical protein
VVPDELHEPAGQQVLFLRPVTGPGDTDDGLFSLATDGRNQDASVDELIDERSRHIRGAGGDQDPVVRSVLEPPGDAVTDLLLNTLIPHFHQPFLGLDHSHPRSDVPERDRSVSGEGGLSKG